MGHVTLAFRGQFFIRRQRASCNVFAHIIWSMYIYSFESYGGDPDLKFRSRDPDHAHFRVNLLCVG